MPVQATAKLRFVSIPPKKMRLVADLVRGLPVEKALDLLNFTPRVAAIHIAKTLKSAAANALSMEGTGHLNPEALKVKTIMVDAAPTAKRIQFQSMGRVYRIRKRHCHLTIVVEESAESARELAAMIKGKADKTDKKTEAAAKKTTAKKTAAKKSTVKKSATKKPKAKKRTKTKTAARKSAAKKTLAD